MARPNKGKPAPYPADNPESEYTPFSEAEVTHYIVILDKADALLASGSGYAFAERALLAIGTILDIINLSTGDSIAQREQHADLRSEIWSTRLVLLKIWDGMENERLETNQEAFADEEDD